MNKGQFHSAESQDPEENMPTYELGKKTAAPSALPHTGIVSPSFCDASDTSTLTLHWQPDLTLIYLKCLCNILLEEHLLLEHKKVVKQHLDITVQFHLKDIAQIPIL